jgi:hypothetical protein
LGELRHGGKIAILALAVESPEDKVREAASGLHSGLHWAMADTPTGHAFGDITAVPTMFLFDTTGKTVRVVSGAPPDLHQQVSRLLDGLLK